LSKYPLLTARKQIQLDFAKNCLLNKDINNFIQDRKGKYHNKNEILENLSHKNMPDYFPQ
jgi:hypothetical protein